MDARPLDQLSVILSGRAGVPIVRRARRRADELELWIGAGAGAGLVLVLAGARAQLDLLGESLPEHELAGARVSVEPEELRALAAGRAFSLSLERAGRPRRYHAEAGRLRAADGPQAGCPVCAEAERLERVGRASQPLVRRGDELVPAGPARFGAEAQLRCAGCGAAA